MSDSEERKKIIIQYVNKGFLVLDCCLTIMSIIFSFFVIPNQCMMSFFLYYTLFYLGQSIQHFLLMKIPKVDAIKYDKTIRKLLVVFVFIEITYMFLAFMFWTRASIHPIYCFVCQQMGLSIGFGSLIILHFIISLFVFIQFVHTYISRKYYLLALGGFQVQQRLLQQRQQYLRRVNLIQPYYNDYPVQIDQNKPNKYYKFDDIAEDVQGEQVCSICLTRNRQEGHPIYTICKHYFHRECIQNWLKINSKCPECRTQFKAIQIDKVQLKISPEQNNQN